MFVLDALYPLPLILVVTAAIAVIGTLTKYALQM